MSFLKKAWTFIGIGISLIALVVCIIHQSVKIDGFDTRKISITSRDFGIYMCDKTGKMRVTYNGDKEYGSVILEKTDENFKNTYILDKGEPEIISCTYGNGSYTLKLYTHEPGIKDLEFVEEYKLDLNLSDMLAPFKGASYYTNYSTEIDDISSSLKSDETAEFVNDAYKYMTSNIEYDDKFAELVKAGKVDIYKPKIKTTIADKKGICISQASLLGSILKQKGIPVKVVIGYNDGNQYHAWIEAFVDGRWLLYDSTLKRTYLDGNTNAYEIVKYY